MNYRIAIIVLFTGLFLGIIGTLWFQAIQKKCDEINNEKQEEINIEWKRSHYLLTVDNLYTELISKEIKPSELLVSMIIIETNNFNSYNCQIRNNLYNTKEKNGTYKVYSHWSEGLNDGYKELISKYNTNIIYRNKVDSIYNKLFFNF